MKEGITEATFDAVIYRRNVFWNYIIKANKHMWPTLSFKEKPLYAEVKLIFRTDIILQNHVIVDFSVDKEYFAPEQRMMNIKKFKRFYNITWHSKPKIKLRKSI